MLHALQSFIEENDDGTGIARFSFLMTTVTEELTEELAEKDADTMAAFMSQIGMVISWIGHGDINLLPDNLKEFAAVIPGTVIESANMEAQNV